ncbi:hypothetical protein [Paenibacillus sp. GXUN7292]|uniref:hypothetical protein n=1 Tax=Paenibacillus sp. GXUN7292 TaxID=3422499 RepID=UPI003D7E45B6
MAKILSVLVIALLMLGIGIFIFNGDDGVKNTVIEGHDRMTEKVRQFDYRSN